MRVRAAIYITAAVMIGAFLIANWALLASSVSLNFLFARVETPLAMVLLLCAGVVLSLDLAIHAFTEHTWRAERRRLMTDVEGARIRAEHAEQEASRTQELRAAMEREFVAIRAQLERVLNGVQRLENDTMDIPVPSARAIEPELVPPRPGAERG